MKGPIAVEVFGDSSFRDNNQQGIVTAIRQAGAKRCNLVGWRSQKSDRRAWSTLAAETHVMQNALNKAIGMKTFLQQLGIRVRSAKVLAENLSLKRVIYSGRQTQEMRLRREIAIIRDVAMNNNVLIRFVPTERMLADDLTKKTTAQRVRDMGVSSTLDMVEDNPMEDPTAEKVDEAARDIPLLREEDEHPKNVDTDSSNLRRFISCQ